MSEPNDTRASRAADAEALDLARCLRPLGIEDIGVERDTPVTLSGDTIGERLPPEALALALRPAGSGTPLLLVVARSLVDGLLQRLLGARDALPVRLPRAPLSPIDRAVLLPALRRMAGSLVGDTAGAEIGIDRLEDDPRYALASWMQARLCLSSFTLRLGDHAGGQLALLRPAPDDPALSASSPSARPGPAATIRPARGDLIIDAVADHGRIRLADIAAWRVGTVIPLPDLAIRPLALMCGGGAAPASRLGSGTLGTLSGRRALRITSVDPAAVAHLASETLP